MPATYLTMWLDADGRYGERVPAEQFADPVAHMRPDSSADNNVGTQEVLYGYGSVHYLRGVPYEVQCSST